MPLEFMSENNIHDRRILVNAILVLEIYPKFGQNSTLIVTRWHPHCLAGLLFNLQEVLQVSTSIILPKSIEFFTLNQ